MDGWQPLTDAFLAGLREILGEDLVAVYLYGALAFPESEDLVGDVDFHVLTRVPFDAERRRRVDRLHGALGEQFGQDQLDGYYVTLEDAQRTDPPPTQMWPLWRAPVDAAWALHRAHLCAGRCVVLSGPPPVEIYPAPSGPALEVALYGEITFVQAHLRDAPGYGLLNACRILLSVVSGNVVVSKRAAGEWAATEMPEMAEAVDLAFRAYRSEMTDAERLRLEDVASGLVRSIWDRIADIRCQRGRLLPP